MDMEALTLIGMCSVAVIGIIAIFFINDKETK
jgi:hypothetical protein